MKNSFLYTLLTVCLSMGSLVGQDFIELFKTQDYDELSLVLSQDVNLKMEDGTKVKGDAPVLSALKKRLTAFNPVSIETRHKGSSEERETDYIIAKLFNDEGAGIRMFIHLENTGDGRKICDVKLRDL